MRISTIAIASFLAVLAGSANGQNSCHGADNNSAHFIYTLNKLTASNQSAFRAKLQLPLVTSSDIVLVSDSTTCARAGIALDSIVKVWVPTATHSPTTAPLYIIRIGTLYAVADLNSASTSDFDWVLIFGPLWEYPASMRM